MSLDNLVKTGNLEKVAVQASDINRLLDAAQRALNDTQIPGLSAESRFDIAYRSIMQAATVALQASGYRTSTSKPGHHQITIQSLTLTLGLDPNSVMELEGLRKQRHAIDYSGDVVSETMAKEAVAGATELLKKVRAWLKERT